MWFRAFSYHLVASRYKTSQKLWGGVVVVVGVKLTSQAAWPSVEDLGLLKLNSPTVEVFFVKSLASMVRFL